MIKTSRIAVGKARVEGRQPSHDGEYITIYYLVGDTSGNVIAENNAGTFCWEDMQAPEGLLEEEREEIEAECAAIYAEGEDDIRNQRGDVISLADFHRSSSVVAEMIELGWATAEEFEAALAA